MKKFYAIETMEEIATGDSVIFHHKRGQLLFACDYVKWFSTKKERDAFVDEYHKKGNRILDMGGEIASVTTWRARKATAKEAQKSIRENKHIYGL